MLGVPTNAFGHPFRHRGPTQAAHTRLLPLASFDGAGRAANKQGGWVWQPSCPGGLRRFQIQSLPVAPLCGALAVCEACAQQRPSCIADRSPGHPSCSLERESSGCQVDPERPACLHCFPRNPALWLHEANIIYGFAFFGRVCHRLLPLKSIFLSAVWELWAAGSQLGSFPGTARTLTFDSDPHSPSPPKPAVLRSQTEFHADPADTVGHLWGMTDASAKQTHLKQNRFSSLSPPKPLRTGL